MSARLRLVDLLGGLSIASDLGFGLPPEQAMRSCLIATALARKLELPEAEVADTFYATLLMHVGCTALAHETAAFAGDDRGFLREVAHTNLANARDTFARLVPAATRGLAPVRRAQLAGRLVARGQTFGRMYDTASCEVASATARRIGLGAGVQRGLYQIFEWWKGGWAPRGLAGEDIALPARLARVGGEAAVFAGSGDAKLVVDALRRRAGGILDPSLVDVFAISAGELLREASAGDPRDRLVEIEPRPVREVQGHDLPRVAAAFADLTDLKTPFTHGHSRAVARIAVAAAKALRLDSESVAGLEVAALLHDIGRAAVSNAVWEKRGRLTTAEWEQVRLHAYHSERILMASRALAPLAALTGMHHERLDGSGYHRGSHAPDLPPPARVLAAADAFQAMTQDRPQRRALSTDEACAELARQARAGRLDGDCVSAVAEAAGHARPRRRDLRPAGLTEREIDVVRLMAEGLSNPEIAARLVISRRTAEHHVQHVYAKLGVSSRAAVALFALEHGLLPAGRA